MKNKNTVLQQLKKNIVPHNCWHDGENVWIDKEAVLDIINKLFEDEQKQIEDAYQEGMHNDYMKTGITKEQYFKLTYQKE